MSHGEGPAQAVLDKLPIALVLTDDERRYVEVNDAACRLLGFERSELLALRVDDIAADRNADLPAMWTAFLASGSMEGQFALRRRDGGTVLVDFRSRANVSPGRHVSVLRERRDGIGSADDSPAQDPDILRPIASGSRWCAIAAGVIGIAVLAGWAFHSPVLMSILPALVPMKANTALGFVLIGSAVRLLFERAAWARRSALVLAGVTALFAVITLCEYAFGWNVGIDELIVRDTTGVSIPGRMSPITAANFFAIALSVALVDVQLGRNRARPADWLALATALTCVLAILGYAYGVRALYTLGPYTSVALHTSVAFLCCAIALLFARPEQGLVRLLSLRTSGAALARRMLPAAIVLPFLLGWLVLGGQRAGLYNAEFSLVLLVLSTIVSFTALVWWNARELSGSDARRLRAELSREKSVQELRAAEAALRKTEDQLRQSQKMDAIGRLAGGVAHDFNNALSVILAYLGVASEELPPEHPVRDDLAQAKLAAEHAASLTSQLLAFSRQAVVARRPLDLNTVVLSLEKLLRRVLGERIELVVALSAGPVVVEADRGQMEQVAMNLAVNARDAMPSGGTLRIETAVVRINDDHAKLHLSVAPSDYVMLAFSDNGIGMTPQVRERIFEPFFTTKEHGRGTGLGLSTVYGIVSQGGGTISVHSEPGRGSTFEVYLPRADSGVDEEPRSRPPPAALGGHETVLLIEDEEPVRRAASRILTRAGFTVLEAENGDQAFRLAQAEGERIDAVLSDVIMPERTGPEVVAQIKAVRPNIAIVFMSGYTDASIVDHEALRGQPYVQKPFTPESLVMAVREALAAKRAARP
jgi:PAS domain S-box-containing protein